ncbi:MAG TPA: G8 domain-containing protein [Candidatus Kapabacteria bacterium]
MLTFFAMRPLGSIFARLTKADFRLPKHLFCVSICGFLLFSFGARANVRTTIASGPWSDSAIWMNAAVPASGDTVVIATGDSVWLDTSTPALSRFSILGTLALDTDTLFLQADTVATDTTVTVIGTLDAGKGWFHLGDSIRSIVHLASGSLFRTSVTFPPDTAGIFDSLHTPMFAVDPGSTFEYYSFQNEEIDISYLANNLMGGAYRNLNLNGCVGAILANPIAVQEMLHIEFGGSTKMGYVPQSVTIHGNVINDNQGASGAPGAGLPGCGMLSVGEDTWIFDATGSGTKDTCHWSGPSQLGSVIVAPNTVLAIRFIDDTHCDSLDILTELTEEGAPCGGHLIGRAFTEHQHTLDATNPIDSFGGLGLTIRSGTDPYLGLTRVVRTSGYLPVGSNPASAPMERYYRITTGAGPQKGALNEMIMQVHCDEWNDADLTRLHFWRSPDGGETWAFSGLTNYDSKRDIFRWDTSVLCWPNDSGSFLWMLSDGYTDIPLPVTLQDFLAARSGANVQLAWQTASETEVVGFEIDRIAVDPILGTDTELLATYWSDDSLRSRSSSGASYHFTDANAPVGAAKYSLYEITDDGVRVWLRTETVQPATTASAYLSKVRYSSGTLSFTAGAALNVHVLIVDALGRVIAEDDVLCQAGATPTIPLTLPPGMFFVRLSCAIGTVTEKIMGGE